MRITLLLLVTVACGGPWALAKRENTANAYATFAANYPEHPKAGRAAAKAEEIAWLEASAADTSPAYNAYIAAFPRGEHVLKAHERSEALAWQAADRANTVASFSGYMASYPMGAHAAEAQQRVELAYYKDAKEADTPMSWGRYIVRYPAGTYAEEARAQRDAVLWLQALEAETATAYQAYLKELPNGNHAEEARLWLDSLKIHTIRPVVLLRETWQASNKRSSLLWSVRNEVNLGLIPYWKRDFVFSNVERFDINDIDQSLSLGLAFGDTIDGVGILVVDYVEKEGDRMDPSGHRTEIEVELALYSRPSPHPIWTHKVTARTPDVIYGSTESALHREALKAYGTAMTGISPPLEWKQ